MATGVKITGNFVPNNPKDTYALLEDIYLLGGYRAVDSVDDMNNIPTERRKWGMLVYVVQDKTLYVLQDQGNNDLSDNSNWVLFAVAGDLIGTQTTEKFELTGPDVSNNYITLSNTPDSKYHIFVYVNGLEIEPPDYSLSDNKITFDYPIEIGDLVVVKYTYKTS